MSTPQTITETVASTTTYSFSHVSIKSAGKRISTTLNHVIYVLRKPEVK